MKQGAMFMLYQQIPALFYSLTHKFETGESVRITHSQFDQLNELVGDYCYSHDVPRLKSLMKRVHRRMEQRADHHLWHTEFDYISNHLMRAMKEGGYCRAEDNNKSVLGVLNRQPLQRDTNDRKSKSRESDNMLLSHSVRQMFDRWLH